MQYKATAVIYNQIDNFVMKINLKKGKNVIDVSFIESGVYNIKTNKGEIFRLIKQ